jgi:AcrR family transcriptional regulator
MSATEPTPIDGRVERRERNRAAVVEALLSLYRDGVLAPSAEVIARRAGVSPRSLFRYFDDLDALVREAIRQQQERIGPALARTVDARLPFDRRVDELVAARLGLYEAMGAVAGVARSVAAQQPLVAGELARIRRLLREQVADLFAGELAAMGPADRSRALAAADVVTSWESVDLLVHDQGLDRAAAGAAVGLALRSLLGSPA